MLSIKDTREYRGTPSIFILKGGIGGFQLQQCDITIGEAVVHLAGRVFMDRPCHGAARRCLERMPPVNPVVSQLDISGLAGQ